MFQLRFLRSTPAWHLKPEMQKLLLLFVSEQKRVQKLEATLSPLLFKGWLSFARVGESSAFQGPCLERYLHTERHKEQGLAVSEGNVRSLSGIPRGRQPKRELVVQGRGDDLRGQEGTIWNAEFRVQGLGERGRHMLRLTSGTAAGCSVPRLPQTVRSPAGWEKQEAKLRSEETNKATSITHSNQEPLLEQLL